MLFQSHLHSDVKSTQELIVFCYGQERVLIPLPKTYETAQARARDVFGLQGDIEFETIDLHGSVGDTVRIHNTAWEGISPVLHTVFIKLRNEPDKFSPTFVGVASSPSHRISAQKRANISSNAGPSRLAAVAAKSPTSASIKKGLVKAPSSRTNSSTGSSHSTAVNVPSRSASSAVPKPESKRAPSPPPAPRMKTPVPSDDEEEEEVRILSPTKKRVQRPRILSDYGIDDNEPEDHAEEAAQSDAERTEDENDELDDAEYASAAAAPPKKAPSPSAAQGHGRGPAKFKPAASLKSGKGSRTEPDEVPGERQPSPKVKVEKVPGKATPTQSEDVATTQSQGTSDESFLVMIEYENKPDSPSLFKTRGRHMVSKVLMQACRTFEIEEYYDRARLVLLVDDGEEVYRSECRRNATMAEAGAEPNARFIVEIEE